ncbi:UNVERIFIED_CONTAM: hypothetical protein FKN15_040958 [Acipenser sinensis]
MLLGQWWWRCCLSVSHTLLPLSSPLSRCSPQCHRRCSWVSGGGGVVSLSLTLCFLSPPLFPGVLPNVTDDALGSVVVEVLSLSLSLTFCFLSPPVSPGVLLHVMGDALGSVVVVVAASLFYAMPLPPDAPCNWQCYVDPSLTIIMVIIILSSAFPLVMETTAVLLQMVPRGLRVDHIREVLAQVPGVLSIHELHIWELAAGRNIATLHLKCGDSGVFQGVSQQVREIFHNAGVHTVTIQPEYTKKDQDLLACNAPCLSEDCRTLGCCNATQPSTNAERHDELGITILPEHCPSQYSRDNVVLKVTQL